LTSKLQSRFLDDETPSAFSQESGFASSGPGTADESVSGLGDGDAIKLEDSGAQVVDPSIGHLLRRRRQLGDEHIAQVLSFQREHGVRFGEAAVRLKLVDDNDVLWALSQQFHYPYAPGPGHANPELVAAADPFSEEAEVFRELRSQLLMGVLGPAEPRRALAIVSPNIGDGKSFLASNLAVAFSQLGGRTLLVDADMRTPRLQEVFGLPHPATGLSALLSGRADANVIRQLDELPNLYLLPVGTIPPNPLELIQRPIFDLVLKELVHKFNYVIVDTPAAAHGADPKVIAAKCGAALVIGSKGRTRVKAMNALVAAIGRSPAKLAGAIMNQFTAA
jgi:protein-tyrosine kinase